MDVNVNGHDPGGLVDRTVARWANCRIVCGDDRGHQVSNCQRSWHAGDPGPKAPTRAEGALARANWACTGVSFQHRRSTTHQDPRLDASGSVIIDSQCRLCCLPFKSSTRRARETAAKGWLRPPPGVPGQGDLVDRNHSIGAQGWNLHPLGIEPGGPTVHLADRYPPRCYTTTLPRYGGPPRRSTVDGCSINGALVFGLEEQSARDGSALCPIES